MPEHWGQFIKDHKHKAEECGLENLNTFNQESEVMAMALLEGISGIKTQHRLEGVLLEGRMWVLFFP